MNNELTVLPPEAASDAIDRINKQWMLIGAADSDRASAMTASWGALGELWNRAVCICFIRPQRYTRELVERNDRLSFSFFGEEKREALRFCGRVSGRDGDKLKKAGLGYELYDGTPLFYDAQMTLICRKLYADDLRGDKFIVPELLKNYPDRDYHRFYVCGIEKTIIKNRL